MPSKSVEKQCPICHETKAIRVDQETCGGACAQELRSRRMRGATDTKEALLQRELSDVRAKLAAAVARNVTDQRYEKFIAGVVDRPVTVPEWASPKRSGSKLVVPTAFLSDQHFAEVVDPAQVNHVNAYNDAIALGRLRAFFVRTVKLAKQYFAGLNYPGIVVPLGGDTFSGNIHEELKSTNETTLQEAILKWLGPMEAGIRLLADEFGKVYLPCVVGNHSRGSIRPVHKGRVRDNFDWLFYQLLARNMRGDKRVSFAIADSPDITYQVFQTRYCLTHGDQFRGGSGISGLLSPMMIGDARKRKRAQAVNLPYDYLVMGHWHQLTQAKSVIVNGSLKGYDEYAFNNNFDYEPPQQAFWLTSLERKGIWGFTPIHVTDSDDPYSGLSSARSPAAFSVAA